MKAFLLTAVVLGAALTASAQTPVGTPPSGTQGQSGVALPSGATSAPKPDATIATQVNSGANQANPADRRPKGMTGTRDRKSKNVKMRPKNQASSTL